MKRQIKTHTFKHWLYWKLTFLRDRDMPDFLVNFIDSIRDLLWEYYEE